MITWKKNEAKYSAAEFILWWTYLFGYILYFEYGKTSKDAIVESEDENNFEDSDEWTNDGCQEDDDMEIPIDQRKNSLMSYLSPMS